MLFGLTIALALAAAVSQRSEYTFEKGDRYRDFVWYTTREGCELNMREAIAGGWAHETGPLGLGSVVSGGPFARCQCAAGNQLSDGLFKSVTMCRARDGGIEISVYTGRACEGRPEEKGSIKSAFVESFLEGICQPLATAWNDAYLDRVVRLEDGVPVACPCDGAENEDAGSGGAEEDAAVAGTGAEAKDEEGAASGAADGSASAEKDGAGRRSAPVAAALAAVAAAAAWP